MKYIYALVATLCVFSVSAKRDYERAFQQAVEQSDVKRVQRLMTRKNKLSQKVLDEVVAWGDDILEERKLMDPSLREVLWSYGPGTFLRYIFFICSIHYYFDINMIQTDAQDFALGGDRGLRICLGICGALGFYCALKPFLGARSRLKKAYDTRNYLEEIYNKQQTQTQEIK